MSRESMEHASYDGTVVIDLTSTVQLNLMRAEGGTPRAPMLSPWPPRRTPVSFAECDDMGTSANQCKRRQAEASPLGGSERQRQRSVANVRTTADAFLSANLPNLSMDQVMHASGSRSPSQSSRSRDDSSSFMDASDSDASSFMVEVREDGAEVRNSVGPYEPAGGGDLQIQTVRARALNHHRQRIDQRLRLHTEALERQERASERRQFLEAHHHLRHAASWSTMVVLALSCAPWIGIARATAMRRRRGIRTGDNLRCIYPMITMRLRQYLRRARIRIAARTATKPTIAQLRQDRVLNLFPDVQLHAAIASMVLRYYFESETIVYMGADEEEGFVVHAGIAEVMMGTATVVEVTPGMCIGTIGMISGEPRSASIVVRGNAGCVLWAMHRQTFEIYEDDSRVRAAHAMLAELRLSNMQQVYRAKLEPDALGRFPLLKDLSTDTLRGMLTDAVPRVGRTDAILHNPRGAFHESQHLLLLKGRVCIQYDPPSVATTFRDVGGGAHASSSSYDQLRAFVDLPNNGGAHAGHPAVRMWSTQPRPPMGKQPSNGGRGLGASASQVDAAAPQPAAGWQCEVTGPALLNVATIFLGSHRVLPFTVKAVTDCDLLRLSRHAIRAQDVLELATMQQNAANFHGDFVEVPTKRDVAAMLVRSMVDLMPSTAAGQRAIDCLINAPDTALQHLHVGKWVCPAQRYLSFEPQSGFLVHLIVDGALETPKRPPPMVEPDELNDVPPPRTPTASRRFATSVPDCVVWPPLQTAWFASRNLVVRSETRVAALRIRRCDVIAWLCASLTEPHALALVATAFGQQCVTSLGLNRTPSFSTFDLDRGGASSQGSGQQGGRAGMRRNSKLTTTAGGGEHGDPTALLYVVKAAVQVAQGSVKRHATEAERPQVANNTNNSTRHRVDISPPAGANRGQSAHPHTHPVPRTTAQPPTSQHRPAFRGPEHATGAQAGATRRSHMGPPSPHAADMGQPKRPSTAMGTPAGSHTTRAPSSRPPQQANGLAPAEFVAMIQSAFVVLRSGGPTSNGVDRTAVAQSPPLNQFSVALPARAQGSGAVQYAPVKHAVTVDALRGTHRRRAQSAKQTTASDSARMK